MTRAEQLALCDFVAYREDLDGYVRVYTDASILFVEFEDAATGDSHRYAWTIEPINERDI